MTMVIPQAGLSSDLLPTVTAFISALPNLGGVLGVGIVGTGTLSPAPSRPARDTGRSKGRKGKGRATD